jgi:hypothetical protein
METKSPLARVVDAIAFAADAHRNQRRKDEALTPYINHPVALVHLLAVEAGIDDPDLQPARHRRHAAAGLVAAAAAGVLRLGQGRHGSGARRASAAGSPVR